jgi:hypothetical protein
MSKNLFIISLVFVNLLLQGCNSVISQTSETEVKSEIPQPQIDEVPKQQKVEFKGVSFSYSPQVLGEVKMEETAERPLEDGTHKPDYVAPQHILFKWKNAKQNRETVIYISSIEDYRRMYDAVPSESDYAKQFDENLRGLQKVIKDKNYRMKGEISFLPFYDAHQTFQGKVKNISFQNGEGIFFLTQIDWEPSLINNEGLIYCFQGISNDGKNYILAKFPVSVSFLPKDYDADKFEDYKLPEIFYNHKSNQKQHDDYVSNIAKRLNNLSPDEFEPNLNYFEEMVSSIKVEK